MIIALDFVIHAEFDSKKELDSIGARLKERGEGALRADVLEWLMSIRHALVSGAVDSPVWRPLFSSSELPSDESRSSVMRRVRVYGGLRRHGFMVAFYLRAPRPIVLAVSEKAKSTNATGRAENSMRTRTRQCIDEGLL